MSDAPSLTLFQEQALNRRRTILLILAFIGFFAWLGFGGDLIYWLATQDLPPARQHSVWWFGIVLTAVGAVIAWYGYRTGPDKVLWSTGAREVVTPQSDQEKQLVDVVEEIAIAAAVPRPRVWIVPDPDPNAFATGIDPEHAHVAVTQGLLDLCNRDELQAVIGHELGHVKNLDVRLMTTLAALVGMVALMHQGVGRMLANGGLPIRGARAGGRGSNLGPLIVILLVLWIVSWILAPLIGQLLAMAVSRRREYMADAMSAQFTRNPLALASALQKIESADAPTTSLQHGAAHLCIADPLGRRLNDHPGLLGDVLGSHPPMAKRITILRGMGYEQIKQAGGSVA